jgi:hypothetical protein
MGPGAQTIGWMTLALLTTSCVVPIPASPDEGDAGPLKDTPIIVKASPVDFPGPIDPASTQMLTLTLKDGDVRDTLYLRVFKNYSPGNESLGIANATVRNDAVGGEVERTTVLDIRFWCEGSAGQNVTIDIVVADEPLEDVRSETEFPFKNPINNGRWSQREFFAPCPR